MSAELIFVSILVLIIISSFIPLINDRVNAASQMDELGNARMIGENVAETLNKVYAGGNGHSIYLKMPENINGKNYEVIVNSTGTYVKINGLTGKSFKTPHLISNSISLKNEAVTLQNNQAYLIKNVEDSNGHSWIVITSA